MWRMKKNLSVAFRLVGGLLAIPSAIALFAGALALKLLPWFPSFELLLDWGIGLGLALLIGFALLQQAERWRPSSKQSRCGGVNDEYTSASAEANGKSDGGSQQV